MTNSDVNWIEQVQWNAQGLVPVIAQELDTGVVLMLAWMNREALQQTIATQHAVYWSRSRQRLWHKGEESGHRQRVEEIRLDCDGDTLLLRVHQVGGCACHTGRHHCFFKKLEGTQWRIVESVLQEPRSLDQKING